MYNDNRVKEDDFRIMFRDRSVPDLRTAKSLCIFKDKPEFNNHESSTKWIVI